MRQIATLVGVTFAATFVVHSLALAQDLRSDKVKESFSILIREITEPERVFVKRTTEFSTVLDAVGSLKLMPEGLAKMDLWIVRVGKDGKPQILPIDWAGITEKGRTETNFEISAGDRLILQARFRK